jgi:hypothetical protein
VRATGGCGGRLLLGVVTDIDHALRLTLGRDSTRGTCAAHRLALLTTGAPVLQDAASFRLREWQWWWHAFHVEGHELRSCD